MVKEDKELLESFLDKHVVYYGSFKEELGRGYLCIHTLNIESPHMVHIGDYIMCIHTPYDTLIEQDTIWKGLSYNNSYSWRKPENVVDLIKRGRLKLIEY